MKTLILQSSIGISRLRSDLTIGAPNGVRLMSDAIPDRVIFVKYDTIYNPDPELDEIKPFESYAEARIVGVYKGGSENMSRTYLTIKDVVPAIGKIQVEPFSLYRPGFLILDL